MTPAEREVAEIRLAEIIAEQDAQANVPKPANISADDMAEKEARLAEIDAQLAENNARPTIFAPVPAPVEEIAVPEVISPEQAELDLTRGSTLSRAAAGVLRPVAGAGQLLVKGIKNSKPVTDFFDLPPLVADEDNEGSKLYQAFPFLFDEERLDKSNKEFKDSSARGRKVYAQAASEKYDRLAAADAERDELPFSHEDRTWETSNKLERLAAYGNTSIKGEGDWDNAGLVGQITASIPSIIAAGPSIGGQALMGMLAGLTTPSDNVSGEGFAQEKGLQAAFGALFGAIGGSVPKFLEFTSPYFKLLFDGDNAGATARMIREAIKDEDKAEQIIIRLQQDAARPPLAVESAGEVAAREGSPEFAALSSMVDGINPGMADARNQAQLLSRAAVFDNVIEQGPPAIALRESVTAPVRTEVLDLAEENSVGRAALDNSVAALEKQQNAVFRTREQLAQESGGSINSLEVQRQATIDLLDASIKVYKDKNISAITTDNIFSGLNSYSKGPEVVGNPVVGKALSIVRSDLQAMVRPDGTIDPLALYTYRKTGMDSAIKKNLNPNGVTTLEQGVIDAMVTSKTLLDDTIEGALEKGGGWTKGYLELYNKMSRPINQAKVAEVLKKTLTETGSPKTQTPKALAASLKAEEDVIRKAGVAGKSFDDVFDKEQIELLDEIGAGVSNTVNQKRLSREGARTAQDGMTADQPVLANALIREVMIANKLFSTMSKRRQAEIMKHLSKLFTRDPAQGYTALANALKDARPGVKKALLARIYDGVKKGTARGSAVFTQAALPVAGATLADEVNELSED